MIKDIGFDTTQPKDLIESNGVISDISKKKNRLDSKNPRGSKMTTFSGAKSDLFQPYDHIRPF